MARKDVVTSSPSHQATSQQAKNFTAVDAMKFAALVTSGSPFSAIVKRAIFSILDTKLAQPDVSYSAALRLARDPVVKLASLSPMVTSAMTTLDDLLVRGLISDDLIREIAENPELVKDIASSLLEQQLS